MVSVFTTIMLCLYVLILSTNIAGAVLVPEKYPFNWYENAGFLMMAQGEEVGDIWKLSIVDGVAQHVPVSVDIIECPDCGHKWKA